MWTAIWEFLVKIVDTIIQYLPDILKARLARKKAKQKTDTKNEMDQAKADVVNGDADAVNKRLEEDRKERDLQ